MFFRRKPSPPAQRLPLIASAAVTPTSPANVTIRRPRKTFDTDHPSGKGNLAITGRYASKSDSFAVDAVYKPELGSAAHLTYGVTDAQLLGVGIESGATLFGRPTTIDLAYSPPQDAAALKLTLKDGKMKMAAYYGFNAFTSSGVANHKSRYELDAKLSTLEAVKLTFDQGSKAAKMRVTRKLDKRNTLQAEYNFVTATKKFVAVTLKHAYSKQHAFSLQSNYGTRKFKVEWDLKTENGPWTAATTFGFNTAPYKCDFTLKRRFEIH